MQPQSKHFPMSNKSPLECPAWDALVQHQSALEDVHIAALFENDPARFEDFSVSLDGLLFDFSRHKITQDTLGLFSQLADEIDLNGWREKLFGGDEINFSEARAVLHTALRTPVPSSLEINGINIAEFVKNTLKKIKTISGDIRANFTITDVVNIGIGGSDLGPRILCEALQSGADGPRLHFVDTIDGVKIKRLLDDLKPEHTVFILASKTFTTQETMMNAHQMREWVEAALGAAGVEEHFYAVTMNDQGAQDFGIARDHILPLRNWIGGRFSVWGAIGLPIAIANGFETFEALLKGARTVDEHFQSAPLPQNIPMLMAFLGVWYNNFWGYHTHAVLPYVQDLQKFPSLVQQLDMESNGKSVDRNGNKVSYATAPVTFGDCGTNGQHAFFQALHQGTQIIPADFIASLNNTHGLNDHHAALVGNLMAQSDALMNGRENAQEPHRHFEGNRPHSMFIFDRLDAYHLGLLLALYEHKVFVQGVLWNVNSFDQWGVELGKQLSGPIIETLQSGHANAGTNSLLGHILEKFIKF